MNKIFNEVFNPITASWVAVLEIAQSAGKKASATSILPPPPLIIILN